MSVKLKDPVSGLTHLAGAILSVAGLVYLVRLASLRGTVVHIISFAVYGLSLIALYSASAVYHLLPLPPEKSQILQRLDHMMIYVLIAGTYTPICLVALRGGWGWGIFGAIWGLALAGLVMECTPVEYPRWLTVSLYVFMGWLCIVAVLPLIRAIPQGGMLWLLAGGLMYSVGAVVYALKRPNPVPDLFGFHELWHLFVVGGSLCHFVMMSVYISRIG